MMFLSPYKRLLLYNQLGTSRRSRFRPSCNRHDTNRRAFTLTKVPRPKLTIVDENPRGAHPGSRTGPFRRYLKAEFSDGTEGVLDLVFLRDSCTCEHCIDVSTTQKRFQTADIPLNLGIGQKDWLDDGRLQITWTNDLLGSKDHTSVFSPSFLYEMSSSTGIRRSYHGRMVRSGWDRKTFEEAARALTYQYEDYIKSSPILHEALTGLFNYGLIFVKSVPSHSSAVKTIAERIGPLKTTFYGETWDVRSILSAKNVAYTNVHLDLHMDLLYMREPPGLQLLHCMKQSSEGGESLFSDTLTAVYNIAKCPTYFSSMKTFKVTYRYRNDGHWYQCTRPILEGPLVNARADGRNIHYPMDFDAVNWSPPFQGPMLDDTGFGTYPTPQGLVQSGYHPSSLRAYLRAAQEFKTIIESPEMVYSTKMEEGTCVIFDNRRVVHGRKAFSGTGGERWLRGAYLDSDCFRSRLRVLDDEYANKPTSSGLMRQDAT